MMANKDIYVLMDEEVAADDDIMQAVNKHMKTKAALPDKYGDLSVYTKGLESFMSDKAKNAIYGEGTAPVKKKQSLKDKILPILLSRPDMWLTSKQVAEQSGLKPKSVQEVLRAAMDRGELTRSPIDADDVRRGFRWKVRQADEPAEYNRSFDTAELPVSAKPEVQPDWTDALESASKYLADVEAINAEDVMPQVRAMRAELARHQYPDVMAQAAETVEPEVPVEMPAETPPVAANAGDLGDFLTKQGKGTVAAEQPPVSAQEGVQETIVQVSATGSVPVVDEREQIENDLHGIFADDYFSRLVQRVIVDGPKNVSRKITVLRILAQLLSNNSKGIEYSRELLELADYLVSFDEMIHYF
jgi:hypothetical protein